MEKIELKVVAPENGEPIKILIEERKGDALPLEKPCKINIVGAPRTVAKWIDARLQLIDKDEAVILVNRELMTILLLESPSSIFGTSVMSKLELSKQIKDVGFNGVRAYDNYQLASFIRMNRHLLLNKADSLELVSKLTNLKIKADKIIETSRDNRGSVQDLRVVAIKECNIPTSISFFLPVFKGCDPTIIVAELDINPVDYSITLASPDLVEIIEAGRNEVINSELELLKGSGIVIIEVI